MVLEKTLESPLDCKEIHPVNPIAPAGTPFQQDIWEILRSIPYGETRTYGQIAELYAQKHGILRMSAQAVGGAVGHNPISILIPCHRVVGADGSLTGYAGGLFRKTFLLELENQESNHPDCLKFDNLE